MDNNDRREEADRKILVMLMRRHPGLQDGALAFLLDEAHKTVEYNEHVTHNDALDLSEILSACERSDAGQMIFSADRDDEEGQAGPVDHERATADMTAQQRLIYARQNGLK